MPTITTTEAGASGRYIDLGSPANQDDIGAQTVVVYCKPVDQASNIGYYFAKGNSSGNGPRLIQTAANLFAFGAGSTGASTQPSRALAAALTLGTWQHLEATWDGTLNYTGINLSVDGVSGGYTSEGLGTGSVYSDASDNVFLLNRTGLGRHVLGDVGWVARWNRVLNSTELTSVRTNGPLSVPSGLILCFSNGQDYSTNAVAVSGRTTQVAGSTPPNTALGGSSTTDIVAAAVCASTAAGVLTSGISLVANLGAQATVGAALVNGMAIAGTLIARCSAVGSLTTGIPLTAALGAKSSAVATIGSPMVLNAAYERSSADLAGSSISGSGDSAIISIRPKMQESEVSSSVAVWMEPSVDITGLNGYRPTFRFTEYHGGANGLNGGTSAWFASRRASYSLDDGLTWNYFDTAVTLDTTNQYIEFRNSTPFAQDKVRIGRGRQVSVHQIGDWLAATAAAYPSIFVPTDAAVAYTPSGSVSGFAAQSFIADEFTAQTDSLGVTIPVQPLYAAMINDTSLMPLDGTPKRVAVITGGVHAGEDSSWWVMRGFIAAALGNTTAAQDLRRRYKILIYPMVNAPGRAGGGWRGQWTQGTGGVDDPNRHYDSAGLGLETVSKPKAAITADLGSTTGRDWAIDFHGTYLDNYTLYRLVNNPVTNRWYSLLDANSPQSVYQTDSYNAGYMASWWMDTLGFKLSTISETGDPDPQTDGAMEGHGAAMVPTLATMAAEGAFDVLAANTGAKSTITCSLTTGIPLAMAATSQATVSAALASQGAIAAQTQCQASITCSLTTGISLAAQTQAAAVAAASLLTTIRLSAAMASDARASGGLSTTIAGVGAAAIADCVTTAALTTEILMACAARCQSSAGAALTTTAPPLQLHTAVQARERRRAWVARVEAFNF